MVVSSVLITEPRLRLDNSRTKWAFDVSVRKVCRIRKVESSNVAVGGLCLFRVLSRSLSTENSVEIEPFTFVLWLKPYFHSRFRKTHRLSKGIENIKKTSARRFVTRRVSSRRTRSRRLDFLDDLSSIYLGDRYVFSPLSSFAWESRFCGLFVSPLPRKVHVSKHPVRDVSQFWTSCVVVCDVWWWPVSSPCSPLLVVSYRCERQMLASSRTHFCQVCYVQKIVCLRISHFRMICLPFSSYLSYLLTCFLRNDSPVRSVLRFSSYASTLSRLVSSAQECQKLTLVF